MSLLWCGVACLLVVCDTVVLVDLGLFGDCFDRFYRFVILGSVGLLFAFLLVVLISVVLAGV